MKNNLISFRDVNVGEINVTMVDGAPYFIARNILDILGIRDTSMAMKQLDDDEKLTQVLVVSGQRRSVYLISESGLYSLILRSRKPEAKRFKKWITKEVLPSIRKTGGYVQESIAEQMTSDPIYALNKMQELITMSMDLAKKNKALSEKAIIDKPKVEFFDAVVDSKDAIEIGKVAKVINVKGYGRNKLFRFLRESSVLRHNNEPYQRYIDNGWFRVVEQKYSKPDGSIHVNIKTLVFQKGVAGIRKLMEQKNKILTNRQTSNFL